MILRILRDRRYELGDGENQDRDRDHHGDP